MKAAADGSRPGAGAVIASLLALAVAPSACSRGRTERPNILLVVVDTLRPDALGSYGAPTPTPSLDRIAAEGLRFERAISQAPWTIPSLASLLTSRYPVEHRQGLQVGPPPPTTLPTLAQRLKASGYATAAFLEVSTPLLREGFDTFEVPVGDTAQRYASAGSEGPSPTFARAEEWLRSRPRRPFFLMIHTYEVHDYFLGKPRHRRFAFARHPGYDGPFSRWHPRPPAEAVGDQVIEELLAAGDEDIAFARSLYDGGVHVVDEEMGRLDAALRDLKLRETTVLVVTSDHGEGFSPRLHRVSHGGRLHDDLLHVPLLVRWPGHVPPGVVSSCVRSIDVVPTLLETAGVPTPPATVADPARGVRGRTLLAPRRGLLSRLLPARYRPQVGERSALAEESAFRVLPSGRREHSSARQIALYSGGHVLIRAEGRDSLFDLSADPDELSDLVPTRPALASELGRELDAWVRALGEARPGPAEDVLESLRALGYVR